MPRRGRRSYGNRPLDDRHRFRVGVQQHGDILSCVRKRVWRTPPPSSARRRGKAIEPAGAARPAGQRSRHRECGGAGTRPHDLHQAGGDAGGGGCAVLRTVVRRQPDISAAVQERHAHSRRQADDDAHHVVYNLHRAGPRSCRRSEILASGMSTTASSSPTMTRSGKRWCGPSNRR